MGMRKGRSGESPHGKNCGMKSRLAGAVRCLVHACLTAAANVGALCMKGWRWMLGAFARTRTSAKRTLTNIEGVLVTLALIATLGIASPLAAGAIEPVEDPTPVSGVLDADGAQIADAADSDDVTDESDVADSDETAKDDTSAEQDATEGDAADEATEDADADADASEKDASTDGERSEDASDGELKDESFDREEANGDEITDARAADDEWTVNGKMIPEEHRAQGTDIFAGEGGSYDPMGYILANYNLFVEEDLGTEEHKMGHIIGPVFAGRDFNNSSMISPNGYTHRVSTYVGGNWLTKNNGGIKNGNEQNADLKVYLGKSNYDGSGTPQLNFKYDEKVLYTQSNQYVNVSTMFDSIRTQTTNFYNSANKISISSFDDIASSEHVKFVRNSNTKYILYLDAGYNYDIAGSVLEQFNDEDRQIVLRTPVPLESSSLLNETIIMSDAQSGFIPTLTRYQVQDDSTTEVKLNSDEYSPAGLPIVYMYPNAITVSHGTKAVFGHIVAPNATVTTGEQYNGCVLAKSAIMTSEGHMWPYNGTRLSIPGTFNIQAQKSLIGRQLNNQEFTFEVYKAKNHWFGVSALDWIEWKENGLVGTKTNGADGNVNFDPIDITEEDFHSGWTIVDWASICSPDTNKSCSITKKFGYIVKEKVPDTRDPVITYDQTVFRVTVPATITFDYSVNSGDPDVTIVAGTPAYSLGSGDIDDHLQEGKPHFINVADTTKLKIKKEIEGYDESKDSKVTFSFQVSLELPDGMSLKAADSSSTQPQKLFFDNMTDSKNPTTYGYACVANDAKNGCKRSGESNVATRQEFYIPEGTTIVLPDDYAQQFRVEIEPIQSTKRSRIKLIAKNTGNPPVVPSEISWPQLVVGSPSSTYVQCPSNPDKKCTQITLKVTGQGSAELEKLPLGTKYTITEQPSDDFSLVGFNGGTEQSASGELTGKDSSGNKIESITVTAKNKRKPKPVSLVIMKRVVDANNQEVTEGLPDDAVFTIEINLSKEGYPNNRVPGKFDYKKTGDGQKEEYGKLSCNANGCDSITLKPWQTITITGLPEGTQFNVAETDAGGFEHVSTVVSQPATCASTFAAAQTACQLNNGAQGVVTVTNRYVTVVLPETGGKAHPFMTMLFGVGVVCAGLLITAIYMRRQGMAMLQ
ncbi:MAG: DUF5979 domain-containing protein [Bifidobacterium animalis]|nr:DUF5979 domain-containing protein [Bifidobacterium animalis]